MMMTATLRRLAPLIGITRAASVAERPNRSPRRCASTMCRGTWWGSRGNNCLVSPLTRCGGSPPAPTRFGASKKWQDPRGRHRPRWHDRGGRV